MKYTITQFLKEYSNDDICLDKIFDQHYDKMEYCPKCEKEFSYTRVKDRQCYQCTKCYNQIYPCVGTIFEKSRTPLTYWFLTMFLFVASKNGVSAYEIQRQLGVTYKCAWRMLKQIRILMSKDEVFTFSGTVELDETFVGGKNINRHRDKKVEKCQGRSFKDKTPVFGIFHRETKTVKTFVVADTKRATLQPIIYDYIELGSTVYTDEWSAYNGIESDYNREFVNHRIGNYANGDCTTNAIENFWSNFKRTLKGSYISVSKKYLQLYANEASFRFNRHHPTKCVN
jgi:transposase-like protein